MDSVSKPSNSSSSLSLTELSDALQSVDAQGCKVSDISSDASLLQMKEKVTRSILAKPSRAMKLRNVSSIPLKESGHYIKTIGTSKNRSHQRKAAECFVDVLFKTNLTDDALDEIIKCIDSSKLTPRKLSTDHVSLPCFLHVNDSYKIYQDADQDFENVYLRNSSLMWRANPMLASNEARLTAINAVLDWVYHNYYLFRDKTLTLVSLGSGCLLMEHLIHQELLEMGVSKDKIQWRCIDTRYQRTMVIRQGVFEFHHESMRDFENDKKECVRFFSTEDDYLNTKVDDVNLSASDRGQGPVILLSFVPHCLNENSGSMHYDTKEDVLVGTIVKGSDFKKANSICLINSGDVSMCEKTRLREEFKPGSCHSEIIDSFIKAWIDRKGTFKISFGTAYRCEDKLTRLITSKFLQAFNNNHCKITRLEKIEYAFQQVHRELDFSSFTSTTIFPLADYFVSLNELHQFFNTSTASNGFPGVLCELLLNEVKMSEKHDESEAEGATSSKRWKAT